MAYTSRLGIHQPGMHLLESEMNPPQKKTSADPRGAGGMPPPGVIFRFGKICLQIHAT